MRQFLFSKLQAFRQNNSGSVTVEFVIYVPLLLWTFAAIYTFFDAFRQESVNLKATYTISDLISRETDYINNTYLDSMYTMAGLLIRSDSNLAMRISVVRWDEEDARYYVDWSKVRGTGFDEWTDDDIHEVKDDLPTMPDQERVILVETTNTVEPAFQVGIPTMDIENFVFTRPRFAPQVVFVDDSPNGNSHNDNAMKVN